MSKHNFENNLDATVTLKFNDSLNLIVHHEGKLVKFNKNCP